MARMLWLGAALFLVGCEQEVEDDPIPEIEGPVLEHEVPAAVMAGEEITLSVQATDPDGVASVTLYHRVKGLHAWSVVHLQADGQTWSGTLPGEQVQAPGVEYYFRGIDASAHSATTYLPREAHQGPLVLPVSVAALPLPFEEGFEVEHPSHDLDQLGWASYSQGFEGYYWRVTTARSHTGEHSVTHRRGLDGLPELDDWLVSPPLDLSSLDRIQVSWYEHGIYSHLADHSLWVATDGQRDPRLGGYELVAELEPPPEGKWGRSRVVDLSDWAGHEAVYLAWRYRGQFSDTWSLDDVSVRELQPDPAVLDLAWEPDPVRPGQSTLVTVLLQNHTDRDSGPLLVDWVVEPGHGHFEADATAPAIAGGATAELTATLTVDPSFPDNDRLPFTLHLDDGDHAWAFDLQLVVGEPSTAEVVITTHDMGLVQVSLGVGDPTAPGLEIPLLAAVHEPATHTLQADLTGLHELLPPERGERRWWVRVDGISGGTLDDFHITHDGLTTATDDLGGFVGGLQSLFYLPPPPEPALIGWGTTPAVVAPGDTVSWEVTLRNDGAATLGLTTVTLHSDDPSVEVLTSEPVLLAADGWAAGATSGATFSFAVHDEHTTSMPVGLRLLVEDEAESFELRGDVPVPWPVLQVVRVAFTDGDDGILDPGESSGLTLDLANTGGRNSFGAVTCTLQQEDGAATVEITADTQAYGPLNMGSTVSRSGFALTVTDGEVGDDLLLALSCTDSDATYRAPFDVVLGEPPWLVLSSTNDAPDDAIDGYPFDIVNGRYRVIDGQFLEIELISSTPYDPTTLFLESWMVSTGSPWGFYQLAIQSGVARLRGYKSGSGFTLLSEPEFIEVDPYRVRVVLELEPMELVVAQLRAGFGAGFCGGSDYYCDHFPDDWGSPWAGMVTSRFVTMSW